MTRNFVQNLYICAVLIALFASISAGLSLEELSLELQNLKQNNEILIQQQLKSNEEQGLKIQQLEQNDAAKDSRLQELEEKIQLLETKLKEQEKIYETKSGFQLTDNEKSNSLEKQVSKTKSIFRSCKELLQVDPASPSGMYWIDPDGQGVGDDPIYAHCDMTTGKTSVLHDSEDPTDVGHCTNPGCYSRLINYSASTRQMKALAELSSECHQSIRYECNFATLETNGVAQSWWNDRNGVAQYFWSGSNNSIHTCQCGIDHNCVELHNFCNCDSGAPVALNDSGVITDKNYLPITRLNFGRTQLATSSGVHTLGRFECSGQVSVIGMPKSCSDLWKTGHTLSGIYSVMGSDYVETVYCDFSWLPHEQGFQKLIGYADVKSLPVYFYVQKDVIHSVPGSRIPFELTRLNVGGAINPSTGIFTAPRNGIYSFHFSGLAHYPSASGEAVVRIALMLNGNQIGRSATNTNDDAAFYTQSLHSTLELKTGDQVWLNLDSVLSGAYLHDSVNHYTHFTGYLLQEILQ